MKSHVALGIAVSTAEKEDHLVTHLLIGNIVCKVGLDLPGSATKLVEVERKYEEKTRNLNPILDE